MIQRIFPSASDGSAPVDDDALLNLYARPAGFAGPWVSFNFVASVDGAATVEGRSGGLGNATDQHIFQLMRRHADVIVVGAQTIRTEGYGGELLDDEGQRWRLDRGLAAHPPLAIVSGSLDLDPGLPVFTDAPVTPMVVTIASAPVARRAALSGVADVLDAGTDTLDAVALVATLAARGLVNIHSEGGPGLLGTFQSAGLVDEMCLSLSPLLVGGPAGRVARAKTQGDPQEMRLAHVLEVESMLFLRYLRSTSSERELTLHGETATAPVVAT